MDTEAVLHAVPNDCNMATEAVPNEIPSDSHMATKAIRNERPNNGDLATKLIQNEIGFWLLNIVNSLPTGITRDSRDNYQEMITEISQWRISLPEDFT